MTVKNNGKILPFTFSMFHPIEIEVTDDKKELTDIDIYALRYCAISLIKQYYEDLDIEVPSDIDRMNAIQDNEFYLYDFEGFELDEDTTLRTLYMDINNRIIASVYNDNLDHFTDYLVN